MALLLTCFACAAGATALAGEVSTAAPEGAATETAETESTQAEGGDLAGRWGAILGSEAIDPVVAAPVAVSRDRQPERGFEGLVDQFFFRLSVDYTHNWVTFTGDPTLTFITDLGEPFVIDADDNVSFPGAFEDQDDRIYTRLNFGTRGYGSDRLNTYVSLLSYHDLDGTSEGSPFIGFTDSYDGRSRFSLLNAYFDINGLGGDGFFSNVNVRVGRQYTHSFTNEIYTLGAVAMDGVAFDYRDDRFNAGAFVGSRSGIFSSPEDRLVFGANFGSKLGEKALFNYDLFYYADSAIQNFSIEPIFEFPLRVQGHFRMVDEHPVDLGVRVNYIGDAWGVNANLTDRLTDDDFFYDIFILSRSTNAFNREPSLYLSRPEPSIRFSLDGYRQFASWLTLGGRVWLFQLHDDDEQDGFEASFRDWSGNVTITPGDHWEVLGEYRFRDLDRAPVGGETEFANIEFAGETEYQEFLGAVGYRFTRRIRAQVGTYYRLFDTQNRITIIDDSKTNGIFANVFLRLTRNIDFRLLYDSDNDYRVFNPDIQRQHGLRIGFDFHK